MIGIVVSKADPASERIGDMLLDLGTWERETDPSQEPSDGGGAVHRNAAGFELRTFDRLHLELENVADAFSNPEAIVFVSKHAGETGPLLSTHFPGNVANADYGGSPSELPDAATGLLPAVFEGLGDYSPEGYEVGLECTHHGPSRVGAPCLFVEVGSGPDQWGDPEPARAVARAVLDLEGHSARADRTVVGFGGGHYAPRFTRLHKETAWSIGHIAADWGLEALEDPDRRDRVIDLVMQRSQADLALVDGDRPDLRSAIGACGYRVVSETWLRETDGLDLGLVERVEGRLGPVDQGTRFGEAATTGESDLKEIEFPESLTAALNGYDPGAALEALRDYCIAYGTAENGNQLTGSMLVSSQTDPRVLLEAMRPVLAAHYDTVEMTADTLRLVHQRFDPDAAKDRGIPEGPSFGRLASGESVTVDGQEVSPDEVTKTEELQVDVAELITS